MLPQQIPQLPYIKPDFFCWNSLPVDLNNSDFKRRGILLEIARKLLLFRVVKDHGKHIIISKHCLPSEYAHVKYQLI